MSQKQFYQMSPEQVMESLESNEQGLSNDDAAIRLKKHGKNELKVKKEKPVWLIFLSQFKELLIIILIIGGVISFLIGDPRDGTIIFIIVLVNAVIGFVHEYKAGKIIDELRDLIVSPAKVVRNGDTIKISQKELVPGDIILIDEGDKLPADVRLIEVNGLKTNDFALTGESLSQEKQVEPIADEVSLGDRTNMAYAGTTVDIGNATAVVVATGMDTETGKIAGMTQQAEVTKTPLQLEMRRLANQLTVTVVFLCIGLFILGIIQDFSLYISLVYALGVAMAMVPQALPAQVTVALSTGSNRLAKCRAVVKNLLSVETLGSTSVICTDKTGTLTKNEMTVRSIWFNGKIYKVTGVGYEPNGDVLDEQENTLSADQLEELKTILETAALASDAKIHEPDKDHKSWYAIGDPTEAALIIVASKAGFWSKYEDKEIPKFQEFPFDSKIRRMSTIRKVEDQVTLTSKGSTQSILSISNYIYKDGNRIQITPEHKQQVEEANKQFSEEGMRVLAIAQRPIDSQVKKYDREEMETDLTFLGLVAMIDPPKEDVKDAIESAHKAHIRISILTGDHPETTLAVSREIGIPDPGKTTPVIVGTELEKMGEDHLKKLLSDNQYIIFSRVDPEDKLRIVETLEDQDEVVAVTGDGVNDAPALKKAHIGVAMGQRGNDVAKEAARLVLLDDNFSTLVRAVEEGRTIYTNLKKTVFASLTTNVGELTVVLLGLLAAAVADYPIPILAAQILAVDLIGEIGPLTLLTFDPPGKHTMNRPPRKLDDHIFNVISASEVTFMGIIIGCLAFLNFFLFLSRGNISLAIDDVNTVAYFQATTLSYATIVFCQYVNILERRDEYLSLFNKNFWSNKILLGSIVISMGLVMLIIYGPYISTFLAFSPIGIIDWIYIAGSTIVYLVIFEGLKFYKRVRM